MRTERYHTNGWECRKVSEEETHNGDHPPGRVLVVDDESVVGDTVRGILSEAGFACDVAYSENEALNRLAKQSYDCMVSDIRMPGIGGIELAKRARLLDGDLEVVLMTGMTDAATARAALKSNACDYLVKPFDLDELVHSVGMTLEHRRLVLENREYQQHLEEKVTEQAEKIRHQFFGAIRSLAKAIEARDEYTRGHSERVGDLSRDMARVLGLSPEESDLVRLAGLLHDIGKIGVSDGILRKKGPLDNPERLAMQIHPTVGRDIITLISPPMILSDGVLHHHERWDGHGYPDGQAGTAIPLVGRILAVADAWDAMTSARPYRDAFSHEEGLLKLTESRGAQHDPEIVDVAMAILEAKAEAELARAEG